MAIGNALLFAFNRHYRTLITCGVALLASLANTAMPQLFALAREYADNLAREVMFSSVMRAQFSLAWVAIHRWPLCWWCKLYGDVFDCRRVLLN